MNEIKYNFKLTLNGYICDARINGIKLKIWYTEGLEMLKYSSNLQWHDDFT